MGLPNVQAVLIDELARNRDVDRDELLRSLAHDGTIDSLEGLELAIAAEQAFGISISDDELSSGVGRSVPALIRLVRSKVSQSGEIERGTR